MMARAIGNMTFWFENELRTYPSAVPDLDALRAAGENAWCSPAAATPAATRLPPNQVLAQRLGRAIVEFPGGHVGYAQAAAEFAGYSGVLGVNGRAAGSAEGRRRSAGPRQRGSLRNAVAAAARKPGSATPHSSRAECIESTGMPTSTVRMPSRVAVIGPTVEPHGTVFFETNTCVGTSACAARAVPGGGAGRVGGVALVGVDLQRGPLVGQRPVLGVVPLQVVRVHGVRDVHREAARRREHRAAGVEPAREPGEQVLEQRARPRRSRSRCRSPRGRSRRRPA